MSEISAEQVAHLANLARIALTEEEIEHLTAELGQIMHAVEKVSEVATPDVPPTSHPIPLQNVFRADVVGETLTVEQALAGAPEPDGRGSRVGDPGGGAVSDDLIRLSAAELARAHRRRATCLSVEATQAHLDRIAAVDGDVHAFLHVEGERALETAADIDRRRAAGEALGPLAGVPIAIKDVLVTTDMPSTSGFAHPRGLDPAVRRDRRCAGCARRAWSRSARPTWTSSRWARRPSTPRTVRPTTRGTSSASPAAPAAARRQPSPPSRRRWRSAATRAARSASPRTSPAPSGVKPTYGGVSRYGAIALASILDQVGPVTRTVLDAALLHDVIGGHDPLDSTSLPDAWPSFADAAREGARGDVLRACASASSRSSRLRRLPGRRLGSGSTRRSSCIEAPGRRDRRGQRPALRVRDRGLLPDPPRRGIAATWRSSTRCASALRVTPDGGGTVEEVMAATREAGFGAEVKRRIILGTYALSRRLLRRVLRQRAEGAHAHPARLRRRVRAGRRARDARPRRRRRSSSARRSTTRCDVPERRHDDPGEPRRRARHLDARPASRRRTACPSASSSWRPRARTRGSTAWARALEQLLLDSVGRAAAGPGTRSRTA